MKNKFLIILPIFVLFSSCGMLISSALSSDNNCDIEIISDGEKNVAFIGVHHVGTELYYKDARQKLDSLRKDGYIIFYENVADKKNIDPKTKDTLDRKLRKLIGFNLLKSGYVDTVSNVLAGKYKLSGKIKIVNQTRKIVNIDTLIDRKVDLPNSKLIAEYEKLYGKVKLDDCDFKTPLTDKYNFSSKINKKFLNKVVLDFRNDFIVENIIKEKNNKIVLFYGDGHKKGIFQKLKLKNPNWKEVK